MSWQLLPGVSTQRNNICIESKHKKILWRRRMKTPVVKKNICLKWIEVAQFYTMHVKITPRWQISGFQWLQIWALCDEAAGLLSGSKLFFEFVGISEKGCFHLSGYSICSTWKGHGVGGSSLVTAGCNGGGSTKRYHIDIYDTINSRTLAFVYSHWLLEVWGISESMVDTRFYSDYIARFQNWINRWCHLN